jgi:hypothetical protein
MVNVHISLIQHDKVQSNELLACYDRYLDLAINDFIKEAESLPDLPKRFEHTVTISGKVNAETEGFPFLLPGRFIELCAQRKWQVSLKLSLSA